jgi:DMSO reductase anchor subunit
MFVCATATPVRNAAPLSFVATILLNIGLVVSVLHLGRPLGAWRAFLGLRTSWMSREILAFGVLAGAAVISTLGQFVAAKWTSHAAPLAMLASTATAALGMAAVFCSAMIYVDTRRAFWSARSTFPKFFGTAVSLGCAGAAGCLAFDHDAAGARGFAAVGLILQLSLFTWGTLCFRRDLGDPEEIDHRSARTVWTLLRPLLLARAGTAVGAIGFEWFAAAGAGKGLAACAILAFLFLFASQVLERYFFFTAVVAPRMPGPLLPRKSPLV